MTIWRLDAHGVALTLAENPGGVPLLVAIEGGGPTPAPTAGLAALLARAVPNASLDVDVPPATIVTTAGHGFFGTPSVAGSGLDGRDALLAFTTRWIERDATALTVRMVEERARLELDVTFAVPVEDGCVEQHLTLRNAGTRPFRVDRLMASFPLPAGVDTVTTFTGRWALEFQARDERLGVATWSRVNRRGRTSHDCFPGALLGRAGDGSGPRIGVQLAWSGNHEILIEPRDDGTRVLQIGEYLAPGELILGPGEAVTTPTALFVPDGSRHGVASAFHEHLRRRVLRWPGGVMRPRPVTLNTWEANYFALDEGRLRAQALAAASLGIERFVLDDGWFGRRDDDTRSLGDWTPHPAKFPNGLRPLAEFVTDLGMEFGLWVEPEMVNPDSDLFRAHPDWVLRVDGLPPQTARHQLVLDLARAEVAQHLVERLDAILRSAPIGYLKWDMNRDLTAACGADGRPAYRRQVQALYALLDRLRAAHPDVEIETCASGGGRADAGILARTHRVWTSDGTDPLTRIGIQRGFLAFLPPELMGAHVAASPNHQTGRVHALAFRAIVALPGHFGVELDPLALDAADRTELAGWIALHKRLRAFAHGPGRPITPIPPEDGRSGWRIGPLDGPGFIVLLQEQQQTRRVPAPLRLWPAHAGGHVRLSVPPPQAPRWPRATPAQAALLGRGLVVATRDLAIAGLQLPELPPHSGLVIEVTPVDE